MKKRQCLPNDIFCAAVSGYELKLYGEGVRFAGFQERFRAFDAGWACAAWGVAAPVATPRMGEIHAEIEAHRDQFALFARHEGRVNGHGVFAVQGQCGVHPVQEGCGAIPISVFVLGLRAVEHVPDALGLGEGNGG